MQRGVRYTSLVGCWPGGGCRSIVVPRPPWWLGGNEWVTGLSPPRVDVTTASTSDPFCVLANGQSSCVGCYAPHGSDRRFFRDECQGSHGVWGNLDHPGPLSCVPMLSGMCTEPSSTLKIDKAHVRTLSGPWAPGSVLTPCFTSFCFYFPHATWQRHCCFWIVSMYLWECCPCGLHSVISRLLAGGSLGFRIVPLFTDHCVAPLRFVVSLLISLRYQSWGDTMLSSLL